MTRISLQNIALASLAILIVGTVLNSTAPSTTPILMAGAGYLIIIGLLGLLFAYYYLTVNIWDAGNPAGAVAILAFPLIAYQIIIYSQTAPLARLAGMIIGSLILAAVAILIGLWAKNRIKRHLFRIPAGSSPPSPPSHLAVILGVVFAVFLILITTPVMGSAEYTYPGPDTPQDWYAKDGIQFAYPRGLQVIEGDGGFPNTYTDGMVLVQDPGGHEAITVAWFTTYPDTMPPADLVVASTDGMSQTPEVWTFTAGDECSRQVNGHTVVYRPFSCSLVARGAYHDDPIIVHRWGYIGSWECPRSDRTIMVVLETCGGEDVADVMLDAFLSSAGCHIFGAR